MMNKSVLLPVLFTLLALLGGCTALQQVPDIFSPEPNIRLTDRDSGQIRTVNAKDIIEISLSSNRPTGFGWVLVPDDATTIVADGQPQYETNANNAMGRSGIEKWRFRANRTGNQSLRFEYRHLINKNAPPSGTSIFTFRVN